MGNKAKILMFVGAIGLAILMFIDTNMSFGLWATLFIISMLVAGIGAVMGIVELAKSIKADSMKKD